MIRIDDSANMDTQFVGRLHVFGHQSAKALYDITHVAIQQSQHQAVFVAKIIFDQGTVQPSAKRQFRQRQVYGIAFAHDLASRLNQLVARIVAIG